MSSVAAMMGNFLMILSWRRMKLVSSSCKVISARRATIVLTQRSHSSKSDGMRESSHGSKSSGLLIAGSCCWVRSEEHTSELQSLMRISYAVFCLKKKKQTRKGKTDKHKD